LVVAVDRRIRHTVHDDEGAAKPVTGQAVHIVVANNLAFIDYADAARVINSIAEEDIILYDVVIAVSKRQRAARFKEEIAPKRISARLTGDNLNFAIATIEVIVLDRRKRVAHRVMAGTDAQGFTTIRTEHRSRSEIIVINEVIVLLTFRTIQSNGHRYTLIAFALQVIVVEAVVFAVHHHPVVFFEALRVIEVIDDDFGHSTVIREFTLRAAKCDDRVGGRIALFEDEPGNLQILASQAQVGLPGQEYSALGLRPQRNRSVRGTLTGEQHFKIAPFSIGQNDRIARSQRFYRITVLDL